ncbi:hypothetical protein [Lysinibacter cavernae]|uniref:hypothetical protein n=1 Tax=Lysinibacter cavernae TaxID=1640652 RepID=UPI00362054C9
MSWLRNILRTPKDSPQGTGGQFAGRTDRGPSEAALEASPTNGLEVPTDMSSNLRDLAIWHSLTGPQSDDELDHNDWDSQSTQELDSAFNEFVTENSTLIESEMELNPLFTWADVASGYVGVRTRGTDNFSPRLDPSVSSRLEQAAMGQGGLSVRQSPDGLVRLEQTSFING